MGIRPQRDENQSDCGIEGDFPGDLADYDSDGEERVKLAKGEDAAQQKAVARVSEWWAKSAMSYLFRMTRAAEEVENDRNVSGWCCLCRRCAVILLFFVRLQCPRV